MVTLCHTSKKAYFRKYLSDNTDNPKQTWQGIRSNINIKPTSKFVPTSTKEFYLLMFNYTFVFSIYIKSDNVQLYLAFTAIH